MAEPDSPILGLHVEGPYLNRKMAGEQFANQVKEVDVAEYTSLLESTEGDLVYLKTGSRNQEILGKKGDDVRIDWGYFYLAADKENSTCATGDGKTLRKSFIDGQLTSSKTGLWPCRCCRNC